MIFDNPIKVLCVDDDPQILAVIKLSLEKKKMHVTTVTSVAGAMELLESKKFDIIVSDYHMPEKSGVEFLKELRAKNSKTSFVLFTGRGCEEVVIKALNSGADLYFQKGCDVTLGFNTLAKKIEAIVSKKRKEDQVQEELRKSEEKYRSLVDNSHDIIYTVSLKGVITYVSPSWQKVLGHPTESVIGKSFKDLIHPEDVEKCAKLLGQVDLERKSVEYRVRHIDGTWKWHHTNATALTDENGVIIGFQGSASDVSYFKEIEANLNKANKKLKLISSITFHDIRNCLTVLLGYIDLLENPNPKNLDYLDRSIASINRITQQIDFAKNYEEIGMEKPRWQSISGISLPEHHIFFRNDCYNLLILADGMFEKVIYNLMDNTIRHSAGATRVHLHYETVKDGIFIFWEDNGIGVANNKKEMIFERGFGKNTGLGMFLIREILGITEITIREIGTPGEGVKFEMFVPKKNYIILEDK
jgi:PAS domain S-box-containing protein